MSDAVVELSRLRWIDAVVTVRIGAEDSVLSNGIFFDHGGPKERICCCEGETAVSSRSCWGAGHNGRGKAHGCGQGE